MPVFDINSTEVQNYLQSGKTEQSYPDEVLPRKLSNPTTKKARQCKFEEVTHYEKSARMEWQSREPALVILHVLTNVLKSQDHSACVEDIKSIISDIRKKWESAMCIVSLATPRIDSVKYNMNGQIINAMLRQVFSSSDKVKLLDHSNMCQEGLPNLELLCDDGYHLSEKGCSQLAANMKRAIHSTLQIPIPQRDRSRSRSRYNMYSRGRGRGRGHKSSQ